MGFILRVMENVDDISKHWQKEDVVFGKFFEIS